MGEIITVQTTIQHQGLDVEISKMPDTCPYCQYGIVPNFRGGTHVGHYLYLDFTCVRSECCMFFIIRYFYVHTGIYHIDKPILGSYNKTNFPDLIKQISPSFISIYSQAVIAENESLDSICGMGYRKALEFLIKDYIIYQNPKLEDKVKGKLLGPCINDHIESTKIKEIASRAAWLGNDETHYVRKWDGMDVSHLKQLINLTAHWIETEYLTEKMISDMPGKGK